MPLQLILLVMAVLLPSGLWAQDLCRGLVTDKTPHPRTSLPKPPVGVLVKDPAFGVGFRRITAVEGGVPNPVIKPVYSPVAAWNADETYLVLLDLGRGYRLYDGFTYRFIKWIALQPADVEQIYWDPVDPDLIYYPMAGRKIVQYRISSDSKTILRTFDDVCGSELMFSESHVGMSSKKRIGLACGTQRFVYDIIRNRIIGPIADKVWEKPVVTPSGSFFILSKKVYDDQWTYLYDLDLHQASHFSISRTIDGTELYNVVAYDGGPLGSPAGTLTTLNLTDRKARTIIGPSVGYPYPPSGSHISSTTFKNPNWVWESIIGGCPSSGYCPNASPPNAYQGLKPPQLPKGQDVLDNEIVVANVTDGTVCRVAHHRATGKLNTHLKQPYWAEPHVTASPTGTRAVFASDWENGTTVDTYVIELPSYRAPERPSQPGRPASPPGPRPTPRSSASGSAASIPNSGDAIEANGPAAGDETGLNAVSAGGYSYPASSAAVAKAGASVGRPQSQAAGKGTSPLLSQAFSDFAAGRPGAAKDKLEQLVQAEPRSATARYYLGYAYHQLSLAAPEIKEYAQKAAENIAAAYRIDPTFTHDSRTETAPQP